MESADARPDDHAAAKLIFLREIETAVIHGIDARHHGQLGKPIDAFHFAAFDVIACGPVVGFRQRTSLYVGGVRTAHVVDAAFASEDLPQIFT